MYVYLRVQEKIHRLHSKPLTSDCFKEESDYSQHFYVQGVTFKKNKQQQKTLCWIAFRNFYYWYAPKIPREMDDVTSKITEIPHYLLRNRRAL
jgi:hypothetical protein